MNIPMDQLLQGLSDNYEAKADTITITLPAGEQWVFRLVRDATETRDIQQRAATFVDQMLKDWPVIWDAIKTTDKHVLSIVFGLAETSVEPKLSHYQLLYVAKNMGPLFLIIQQLINEETQRAIMVRDVAQIQETKNS